MAENAPGTSSFLLEIGTEDLPARFITPALTQLRENAEKMLTENYIRFSHVKTYGTPRRLAVIAEGVRQMQEDRTREVFGPSKKVAFDENGNPTKAAAGFARSQGIHIENLAVKSTDKGEYIVAVIEEKGVHVREILPELLRKLVLSVHLPKAMRWGNGSTRFVRPIRWLMTLFDTEVVSFEIEGIQSSNLTRGHRFLSPAAFQVREIPSYKKLLGNNCVIIDPEERKKIITEKVETLLSSSGEKPVRDEELLATVVNLVEYPVPVIASFPEEYLTLPEELLITVMKGHQKYFAVLNNEGRITNRFVVVSNTSDVNAETVRTGAERVIKARFEDARFYFDDDRNKALSDRIEELRHVTFQESLGSLYDKTQRIASIAAFLAERILPGSRKNIIRAAELAKTDLITGVVREFPELQGVMGRYYAVHDGEEQEVAMALEEQYLPAHSGGMLPKTDAGSLLSIADKLDSIAAFFSIGLIPTGSEDPFALRRQALGIVAILLDKGFPLPLNNLADSALDAFADVKDRGETREKILRFFENRIEAVFADQGYAPDIVHSLLPLSLRIALKDVQERLAALTRFRDEKGYNDFLAVIKRVNNILPKTAIPALNADQLREEAEKHLMGKLDSVRQELSDCLRDRRYDDAILLLSSLTGPVNAFFDSVLVMDKREDIKLNRFALLNELWETASTVADFSKLSAAV